MAQVIFKAKFSENRDIAERPNLSLYDTETQEFINSSIAYAKKSKSDIVISKENNDIRSVINITVGVFFGGFKKTFLDFVIKAHDFLILPTNENSGFGLRISATHNCRGGVTPPV